MEYLIGILGLLLLGTVYVGLGLADRGGETCHDCSLAEGPEDCDACPLVVAAGRLDEEPEAGERAGGADGRALPMWPSSAG